AWTAPFARSMRSARKVSLIAAFRLGARGLAGVSLPPPRSSRQPLRAPAAVAEVLLPLQLIRSVKPRLRSEIGGKLFDRRLVERGRHRPHDEVAALAGLVLLKCALEVRRML